MAMEPHRSCARAFAATFAVALGTSVAGVACAPASQRPTMTAFDPTAGGGGGGGVAVDVSRGKDIEAPFPALDRAADAEGVAWSGVSILRGFVRLSRPRRWTVRDAGVDPGSAFVRYTSSRAYSFAIYERSDAPSDLWRDIQSRYEADVARAGAKVVGKAVPVAMGHEQGRAYTIERKDPRPSRSREILVRGERRIVLVQIVTQDASLARLDAELSEVLGSLEVL